MSEPPYKKVHVVINPAAGKDEPILNVLNDVFRQYDVDWSVSITKKYGDATEFARQAADGGADLVAGYGGDGTQHEVANGILGTGVVMGILPGGTGNGFANEMATPRQLRPAVELLCTSRKLRHVDVVKLPDGHFIQRLYIGIEPEEQTSREDKDRYGTFAYAINMYRKGRSGNVREVMYDLTIDGKAIRMPGMKLYVVNAGQSGSGISVTGDFSVPDDGLVDLFVLNLKNLKTLSAATERVLNLHTEHAENFFWRASEITINAEPDQPVWTDGEYWGRTPISLSVLPAALPIVVP